MVAKSTREIFDNVINMVNIVLTNTQKDAAFVTVSSTFFSYVKPVFFLNPKTVPDEVVAGYQDTVNALGLGVGGFEVIDRHDLSKEVALRVVPVDIADFNLPFSYHAAFQYLTDYYAKQIEKDNYGMLTSAGINMEEHIEVESFSEIREYLIKEFSVEVGSTII